MKIVIVVGLVICAAQGIFGACVCESGWTNKGNQCYKLFATPQTAANAQFHCLTLGSTLAEPLGPLQNGYIKSIAAGKKVYIGINDVEKEKQWLLVHSGVNAEYTNWHSGEPNNAIKTGEDCAEMYNTGTWNDLPCEWKRAYVCQKTA